MNTVQAAEAARQIIANGEKGKACFQEGHGAEPCPTIDYHPKEDEHWYVFVVREYMFSQVRFRW